MDPINPSFSSRAEVLMYPNLAAEELAANPPGSSHSVITDEVLATRAGVLRFPNQAEQFIANPANGLTFDNTSITFDNTSITFDATEIAS